jgi:S-adenosylmethionine decarboxylase
MHLPPSIFGRGVEWIVDAHGCRPDLLRSEAALASLFDRVILEQSLKPVGPRLVHAFPAPGGITALVMLSESHLTCHTFPETGYASLNLYCCRPRSAWPFEERLAEILGASSVLVRSVERPQSVPATRTSEG